MYLLYFALAHFLGNFLGAELQKNVKTSVVKDFKETKGVQKHSTRPENKPNHIRDNKSVLKPLVLFQKLSKGLAFLTEIRGHRPHPVYIGTLWSMLIAPSPCQLVTSASL